MKELRFHFVEIFLTFLYFNIRTTIKFVSITNLILFEIDDENVFRFEFVSFRLNQNRHLFMNISIWSKFSQIFFNAIISTNDWKWNRCDFMQEIRISILNDVIVVFIRRNWNALISHIQMIYLSNCFQINWNFKNELNRLNRDNRITCESSFSIINIHIDIIFEREMRFVRWRF